MRSIRRAMLLGSAAGVLLILGAAGVIVDAGARRVLLQELDRSLEDKSRLLASTLALTTKGLEVDFAEYDMREFGREREPSHLLLWQSDGSLLFASKRADRRGLAPLAGTRDDPLERSLTLADGQRVRVVQLEFAPRLDIEEDEPEDASGTHLTPTPDIPRITLVLARDTSGIDATLVRLRGLLLVVGLATALAVLLVLRSEVRRGLRPLDLLAREIAALDAACLTGRIDLPDTPLEIVAVVARLNELMARLDGAFRRERTFSADIAHELRTPLSGLRTSLEVELSRPREAAGYRRTLEESLTIVARMQDMVQTLLLLCRLESGQLPVECREVDLAGMTREILGSLSGIARARGLKLRECLPISLPLRSDPALLETVVRNILANAIEHADENGYVRIEPTPEDEMPGLRVTNSGSRVAQDVVPALFERFVRGDAARGDTGLHCGLGLALIGRTAATLGLAVRVTTEAGGDFSITLSAPKTPAGPA